MYLQMWCLPAMSLFKQLFKSWMRLTAVVFHWRPDPFKLTSVIKQHFWGGECSFSPLILTILLNPIFTTDSFNFSRRILYIRCYVLLGKCWNQDTFHSLWHYSVLKNYICMTPYSFLEGVEIGSFAFSWDCRADFFTSLNSRKQKW